jgi:hypothetical protein
MAKRRDKDDHSDFFFKTPLFLAFVSTALIPTDGAEDKELSP